MYELLELLTRVEFFHKASEPKRTEVVAVVFVFAKVSVSFRILLPPIVGSRIVPILPVMV